jgi:hypothetical protein
MICYGEHRSMAIIQFILTFFSGLLMNLLRNDISDALR